MAQGLKVKGKRLIETSQCGVCSLRNFPSLLWHLGDKPRRSLLYAEYILYIYLYLKSPSNSYKHLPYSNFKIPADL